MPTLPDRVSLVALPGLGLDRRNLIDVAVGSTIAEMIALALPGVVDRRAIRVTIGDQVVIPEVWHRVRPKVGALVVMRVLPAGGGAIRNVLPAIITIAALVTGQYYLGPLLAGTLGLTTGTLAFNAVVAATGLGLVSAASLLFKALVPAKPTDQSQASQTYSIQGFQNAYSPNGVIPCILGLHRYAPAYAAIPYTESDHSSDQYVIGIFCLGFGPVAISNPRLGENSIDNYTDVQIEIREGYDTDELLTLFTLADAAAVPDGGNVGDGTVSRVYPQPDAVVGVYTIVMASGSDFEVYRPDSVLDGGGSLGVTYSGQIGFKITAGGTPFDAGDNWSVEMVYRQEQTIEESLTGELKGPSTNGQEVTTAQPQIKTTARDITAIAVEFFFPSGLYNGAASTTVRVQVRYRLVGDVSWLLPDLPTSGGFGAGSVPVSPGLLDITEQTTKPLRVSFRWDVSTRGQYEVEITRVTAETPTDTDRVNGFVLSAVRGFRPEYPINFDKPLALIAVRIKATGQLNGTLDNFNCDVQRVCPDWDTDTETWITRITRNPASLYRFVLQGPANPRPLTDDQIDLAALADWHDFCRLQGLTYALTYDRIHDYQASTWDVLSDVARAGRAAPWNTGTQWSVVIDRAQSQVVGHITPRNSWGFSGERPYARFPDAFKASFPDETSGYQTAERVVPWPGFEGDPDVVENIQVVGVTNPDLLWRTLRRRQYELIYRPDRYTVSQDIEALQVCRGVMCALNTDVLDRVQVAARVKAVNGNIISLDTQVTIETGVLYACRFRLANGDSLLLNVLNNRPAEVFNLIVDGSGDMPAEGDIAMFGVRNSESREVLVQSVEVGENITARLTLMDHAPEIDESLAADVPPVWSRVAG